MWLPPFREYCQCRTWLCAGQPISNPIHNKATLKIAVALLISTVACFRYLAAALDIYIICANAYMCSPCNIRATSWYFASFGHVKNYC